MQEGVVGIKDTTGAGWVRGVENWDVIIKLWQRTVLGM